MRLKVLGCSGGIGDGRNTTCLQVDDDILIDAGTGAGMLSAEAMTRIDHVFLTHAHLDHIALLPLLVDAARKLRSEPVTVHGIEETIVSLRDHIFNWHTWPDMTALPSPRMPAMRYATLSPGVPIELKGRRISALPAAHTIPATGFRLDSAEATVVISGDTTLCEPFWNEVKQIGALKALIIELSYGDQNSDIAHQAGHLCPSMLEPLLAEFDAPLDIYFTHLKPADSEQIEREALDIAGIHNVRALREGDRIDW